MSDKSKTEASGAKAAGEPTIQSQMTKLTEMVNWFDGDDFSLEEAIDKYEQLEKLAGEIETKLMGLKNQITVIKDKFNN